MFGRAAHKATFEARVFRCAGNVFRNPNTGLEELVPAVDVHQGRVGCWYDHGTLTQKAVLVNHWGWLRTRLRIELREILLFIRSLFKRGPR